MKLSKINTSLLAVIIILNLYIIAAPFFPALLFSLQNHTAKRKQLTELILPTKSSKPSTTTSQPNHVVIPSMLLDQPILEGTIAQEYKVLDQGIWRYSKGSTPDKGGNTVLIGHRFTYTIPKGVFYYLNKVSIGDNIGVFWNQKEYLYTVDSINVVPPNDTAIEKNSSNSELTLFTCTPLALPKDRLVIVANLDSSS